MVQTDTLAKNEGEHLKNGRKTRKEESSEKIIKKEN
jgi:hypothetical protein